MNAYSPKFSPICGLLFVLIVVMGGCEQATPEVETTSTEPQLVLEELNVLVVGDSKIGPAVKRQWSARRDGTLKIFDKTIDEFEKDDFSMGKDIDVIIYPPSLMGELISRSRRGANTDSSLTKWELAPSVWSDDEYLNNREILKHPRSTIVRFDGEVAAVPLGNPQLVMFYRADVLKALGVDVPKTWEQFASLTDKLSETSDLKAEDGSDLPTSIGIPMAESWAGITFLARAAANIRSRGKLTVFFDREDMNCILDSPPFVLAMSEFAKSFAKVESLEQSPEEVYRDMVSGKLALAITWPSGAFEVNSDSESPKVIEAIEIARIPGSTKWYSEADGWRERDDSDSIHVELLGYSGFVASPNPFSGRSLTAYEFLKWLPSKSISLATVAKSSQSGPFRASHLGNPAQWTGDAISPNAALQYADVIREINNDNVVLQFPRIPGYDQYMVSLGETIRNCVKGELGAEEAMKKAKSDWDAISEKLGVENQRLWLRNSQIR